MLRLCVWNKLTIEQGPINAFWWGRCEAYDKDYERRTGEHVSQAVLFRWKQLRLDTITIILNGSYSAVIWTINERRPAAHYPGRHTAIWVIGKYMFDNEDEWSWYNCNGNIHISVRGFIIKVEHGTCSAHERYTYNRLYLQSINQSVMTLGYFVEEHVCIRHNYLGAVKNQRLEA